MTTYYQSFSAPAAITIMLNSLGDGSAVNSNAIDNSSTRAFEGELEVKLTGSSGSTAVCEIYLLRSVDSSDFTDSDNAELVGVITMNGTSAVIKVFRVYNLPEHYKYRLVNASGGALAGSGNGMAHQAINQTDV